MPKRAATTERPDIALDPGLPEPLYKQLYDRLRHAILSGQLPRGARLPSTRALAAELGISRGTTALAYEQLLLEGYLESQVGSGTVVSPDVPDAPAAESSLRRQEPNTGAPVAAAAHLAKSVERLRAVPNLGRIEGGAGGAFRGGQPALDLFPYQLWGRLISRRARRSLAEVADYQPPAGYLPLRETIAARVGIARGVQCTPDQIILTAGAQGALDLVARTLLNPGDEVWIEDPGYFGAQGAAIVAGARLVPVPVDDHGLKVATGRQRSPEARLVFTSPSHQFPTGVTMSLGRRRALLEWARQAGAWIVEDDYDSEFRFGGRPLEALQGLQPDGRVIYVGTFSKVLFPALRLGYLVAPPELIDPLILMRRFTGIHLPMLEQMALADFMQEGHYDRHLRRMRQQYQRRRELLRAELRRHLGGLVEVSAPEVGMHLVAWLPPGVDDIQAAALVEAAGLAVTTVSRFSLEPVARGGLVLGFGSTDEAGIRHGVRTLATALEPLHAASAARSPAILAP